MKSRSTSLFSWSFLGGGLFDRGLLRRFLGSRLFGCSLLRWLFSRWLLGCSFFGAGFFTKEKTKQIRERESIFAPLPVQIRCDTGRTAKRGPSHMAGAGDICITAPKFAHKCKGFSSDFKQSNHKLCQTESKTWLF